jgi:hypothetical protein
MKKTIIVGLIVAILATVVTGAAILFYKINKEFTVFQNHREDVVWEKRKQTEDAVAHKIAILDDMATKLEKKVGNLKDLNTIKNEYLPSVIQHRFEKCLDGSHEEKLDQLSLEVEVAIGLVLFTQELLEGDRLSSDYLTFKAIARDKTSQEIKVAHMAAQEKLKAMMLDFRKQDKEIASITWAEISAESKAQHQARREWLKRSH